MLPNRSLTPLVVAVLFGLAPFAPGRGQEDERGTAGMGLDGSTGLFVNPSPLTLPVGHARVGLFTSRMDPVLSGAGGLPLAFSVGLSEKTEVTALLAALPSAEYEPQRTTTMGLKLNALRFGAGGLSADIRVQLIEQVASDGEKETGERITGRLIAAFPLWSSVIFVNSGYTRPDVRQASAAAGQYPGGLGIVLPFAERVMALAEFQVDDWVDPFGSGARGTLGFKLFAFGHLQLAAGILGVRQGTRSSTGVFFNLGFSTAALKAFPRGSKTFDSVDIPSLEELDGITASSMDAPPAEVPVESPAEERPLLDELGLPYPPPLPDLDSWGPDESWYHSVALVAAAEFGLPQPPPLELVDPTLNPPSVPQQSRPDRAQPSTRTPVYQGRILPMPPPLDELED